MGGYVKAYRCFLSPSMPDISFNHFLSHLKCGLLQHKVSQCSQQNTSHECIIQSGSHIPHSSWLYPPETGSLSAFVWNAFVQCHLPSDCQISTRKEADQVNIISWRDNNPPSITHSLTSLLSPQRWPKPTRSLLPAARWKKTWALFPIHFCPAGEVIQSSWEIQHQRSLQKS